MRIMCILSAVLSLLVWIVRCLGVGHIANQTAWSMLRFARILVYCQLITALDEKRNFREIAPKIDFISSWRAVARPYDAHQLPDSVEAL